MQFGAESDSWCSFMVTPNAVSAWPVRAGLLRPFSCRRTRHSVDSVAQLHSKATPKAWSHKVAQNAYTKPKHLIPALHAILIKQRKDHVHRSTRVYTFYQCRNSLWHRQSMKYSSFKGLAANKKESHERRCD